MKTAWMVDDDDEMIHAVKLLLSLLDYEGRSFHNAKAAAKALLEEEPKPDIIILDVNMPEVSGVDLLEFIRMRSELRTLPVLMLSSESAETHIDTTLAMGADAYVTKPVTMEELEQAIHKAIRKRHSLRRFRD